MDLPVELIIYIFGNLAPPDVLSLAATCKRFLNAWQQHTTTIYNLTRHTIECERDARTVLADQGVLPADCAITVPGFLQLRRNAHVMERIIDEFNRKYMARWCCHLAHPRDREVCDGNPRPPHLTRTERPRFVRTAYKLWGLFLLSSSKARQQRIESYTMKDLISLEDTDCGYPITAVDVVTSVIKAEAKQPSAIGLTVPNIDSSIYRHEILGRVKNETERVAQYAYGCDHLAFHSWDEGGWWGGPISLFDDWRSFFRAILVDSKDTCGQRVVPVDEVWYETSDEEIVD